MLLYQGLAFSKIFPPSARTTILHLRTIVRSVASPGNDNLILRKVKTMAKSTSNSAPRTAMTAAAAARIQSATAKVNSGKVAPNSFAARAQSAAAQNGKSGSDVKQ